MPQAYILLRPIHPEHFSFIFKNTHTSNQTAVCSFLPPRNGTAFFLKGKLQKENLEAWHDVWHGLGTGNETLQWEGETFCCHAWNLEPEVILVFCLLTRQCACSLWRAESGVQPVTLKLSCTFGFQQWSVWKSQLGELDACRSTEMMGKAAPQWWEVWWLTLGVARWWPHLHRVRDPIAAYPRQAPTSYLCPTPIPWRWSGMISPMSRYVSLPSSVPP